MGTAVAGGTDMISSLERIHTYVLSLSFLNFTNFFFLVIPETLPHHPPRHVHVQVEGGLEETRKFLMKPCTPHHNNTTHQKKKHMRMMIAEVRRRAGSCN
jgi:hypothetical protein